MKELIDIGQQARERRKARGWSQSAAASQIQAHRNEVSRIENGGYRGNLTTFCRYLNLLGLSLRTEVTHHPTLDDLDSLFNKEISP